MSQITQKSAKCDMRRAPPGKGYKSVIYQNKAKNEKIQERVVMC